MATLKLGLDTRTCKDGRFPVRFRLSINNTSAYIYTGTYATEKELTGDKYNAISRRAYMAKERSEIIGRIARKYDEVLFALQYNGTLANMTANELREYIVEKRDVVKKQVRKASSSNNDFLAFFGEYTQSRKTANTIKHYEYIGRVLLDYCRFRGLRTLSFDDIEYSLLVDLKSWLRNTGKGEATRFKTESYVRAAYREGARRIKRSRDKDPFFDYKIEKVPETEIEVLSVDDIRRLMSLDLSQHQGADSLERTRDILLASFCLGGANLIDIYNMDKPADGEAVFVRHKVELVTKRPIHIRIEPELDKILERQAGSEKMFFFAERYPSYSSFQRKTNERCKYLSAYLGRKVNMEIIRRSFATIAASQGVPPHIIDKLMGHTDQTVLDRYYARFDWSLAARYNKDVIQFVMDNVQPNAIPVPKLVYLRKRKAA